MLEAGGLPSQGVGGRRELVWERSGEELKAWVLVLKNTGSVTVDKNNNKMISLHIFSS